MGWKGTLRSINASMRAAERENQRRYKAAEKKRVASEAADAVDDWKQEISDLTSIHSNLTDAINWQQLAIANKPSEPGNFTKHRELLVPKLKNFKSGLFDILHGGTQKRKEKLITAFEVAKQKDEADKNKAIDDYQVALSEWQADTLMAKAVLSGDPKAAHQIVSEMQTIFSEGMVGKEVCFKFGQNFLHAILEVYTDEIVPNYKRKQLASGKLSETKMPVGEFNELYQDYVASAALKIAGDLFHIFPYTEIYVTCTSMMLNKTTGHQKPTPILSVQFIQETFMRLNLTMVDPSDCLENFNHSMAFRRTKGFSPVTPLHPVE